jgi:hypothetical protein
MNLDCESMQKDHNVHKQYLLYEWSSMSGPGK